jgi:hypothetical protein
MLRASREKENPRGGDLWGFLHSKTRSVFYLNFAFFTVLFY